MPDISMCGGGDCPKRKTCFRYRAFPHGDRQSWMVPPPYDPETGLCDHYWDAVGRSRVRTFEDCEFATAKLREAARRTGQDTVS